MSVPYRPQLWAQVAFNADPNSTDVPRWTDLTHMVSKIGENARGRQYELGVSQAAEPDITWRDPDEYLNPANTSSPYYPFVEPYRQVLVQAMWPNGGTGNLLNSGRWKANNAVAPDPSLESYANGAALPGWLTAVGATVPTVTTTNPQQGTKSLTYTVAATGTRQGVSWEADCVPGQQYTSSVYVRQSTASTQRLLVGGQTLAYDNFGRSASNGWGTADAGGAWFTAGGSASDFSVAGGVGKHSIGTLNVRRFTNLGSTFADVDLVATITVPSVITGGVADFVIAGLAGRYADADNHYRAELNFQTENTLALEISKRVSAVTISLDVLSSAQTYAAGTSWKLRLQVDGTTIRARFWSADDFEPTVWDVEATDTALANPGGIGVTTFASSGVTNTLPVVMAFDALTCVGSTASTTTTTTGSYVRLDKTFTATQDLHVVTVATLGTAVAGTVNVDALQHEPGGTANAFTTDGPVIYPIMRHYTERWPREYEDAGFLGVATTPCVDAFAAFNGIRVSPDYVVAVRALDPDFYWQMNTGTNPSSIPEVSGNLGPALYPLVSKFGAGTDPAFGASMDIGGDAGATGVRFTAVSSPPDPGRTTGTVLGAGWYNEKPGPIWPRFPGNTYPTSVWRASLAVWIQPNTAVASGGQALMFFVRDPLDGGTGTFVTAPLLLQLSSGGDAAASTWSPTATLDAEFPTDIDDGFAHLLVGVVEQVNGGNTTVKLYVDGTLVDTSVATTASMGGMYTLLADSVVVGGFATTDAFYNPFPGIVGHGAAWSRELSADEVTTLWTAGGLGHTGETTGERLTRHLGSGRYTGATRISTGSTVLQAATWSGSIILLQDAQNLAAAEDGVLWVAADGALVMEGRQDRWLRLTASGTFGEAETPYEDGLLFDYDPAFVWADVLVSRINGATAVGGTQAAINLASRKYFPRSNPADSNDYATDDIAQSKADWIFATHRAPLQRVSQLTIDPAANPALWPVALSTEIGQRKTVIRRAKAANGGAGLTMQADYFIERVVHHEINMETGAWKVSFLLSPIGSATSGNGVTFQPWILGDSTYGVLNSTTILGW